MPWPQFLANPSAGHEPQAPAAHRTGSHGERESGAPAACDGTARTSDPKQGPGPCSGGLRAASGGASCGSGTSGHSSAASAIGASPAPRTTLAQYQRALSGLGGPSAAHGALPLSSKDPHVTHIRPATVLLGSMMDASGMRYGSPGGAAGAALGGAARARAYAHRVSDPGHGRFSPGGASARGGGPATLPAAAGSARTTTGLTSCGSSRLLMTQDSITIKQQQWQHQHQQHGLLPPPHPHQQQHPQQRALHVFAYHRSRSHGTAGMAAAGAHSVAGGPGGAIGGSRLSLGQTGAKPPGPRVSAPGLTTGWSMHSNPVAASPGPGGSKTHIMPASHTPSLATIPDGPAEPLTSPPAAGGALHIIARASGSGAAARSGGEGAGGGAGGGRRGGGPSGLARLLGLLCGGGGHGRGGSPASSSVRSGSSAAGSGSSSYRGSNSGVERAGGGGGGGAGAGEQHGTHEALHHSGSHPKRLSRTLSDTLHARAQSPGTPHSRDSGGSGGGSTPRQGSPFMNRRNSRKLQALLSMQPGKSILKASSNLSRRPPPSVETIAVASASTDAAAAAGAAAAPAAASRTPAPPPALRVPAPSATSPKGGGAAALSPLGKAAPRSQLQLPASSPAGLDGRVEPITPSRWSDELAPPKGAVPPAAVGPAATAVSDTTGTTASVAAVAAVAAKADAADAWGLFGAPGPHRHSQGGAGGAGDAMSSAPPGHGADAAGWFAESPAFASSSSIHRRLAVEQSCEGSPSSSHADHRRALSPQHLGPTSPFTISPLHPAAADGLASARASAGGGIACASPSHSACNPAAAGMPERSLSLAQRISRRLSRNGSNGSGGSMGRAAAASRNAVMPLPPPPQQLAAEGSDVASVSSGYPDLLLQVPPAPLRGRFNSRSFGAVTAGTSAADAALLPLRADSPLARERGSSPLPLWGSSQPLMQQPALQSLGVPEGHGALGMAPAVMAAPHLLRSSTTGRAATAALSVADVAAAAAQPPDAPARSGGGRRVTLGGAGGGDEVGGRGRASANGIGGPLQRLMPHRWSASGSSVGGASSTARGGSQGGLPYDPTEAPGPGGCSGELPEWAGRQSHVFGGPRCAPGASTRHSRRQLSGAVSTSQAWSEATDQEQAGPAGVRASYELHGSTQGNTVLAADPAACDPAAPAVLEPLVSPGVVPVMAAADSPCDEHGAPAGPPAAHPASAPLVSPVLVPIVLQSGDDSSAAASRLFAAYRSSASGRSGGGLAALPAPEQRRSRAGGEPSAQEGGVAGAASQRGSVGSAAAASRAAAAPSLPAGAAPSSSPRLAALGAPGQGQRLHPHSLSHSRCSGSGDGGGGGSGASSPGLSGSGSGWASALDSREARRLLAQELLRNLHGSGLKPGVDLDTLQAEAEGRLLPPDTDQEPDSDAEAAGATAAGPGPASRGRQHWWPPQGAAPAVDGGVAKQGAAQREAEPERALPVATAALLRSHRAGARGPSKLGAGAPASLAPAPRAAQGAHLAPPAPQHRHRLAADSAAQVRGQHGSRPDAVGAAAHHAGLAPDSSPLHLAGSHAPGSAAAPMPMHVATHVPMPTTHALSGQPSGAGHATGVRARLAVSSASAAAAAGACTPAGPVAAAGAPAGLAPAASSLRGSSSEASVERFIREETARS